MAVDPTARFSPCVDDYDRFRPAYPPAVVDHLRAVCGLQPDQVLVDLGAGTGLLTGVLLAAGQTVIAIEPNDDMRAAAVARYGKHPRFRSLAGRAEATGLDDQAADLVTVAQALHWFEPQATRRELLRVLKPGGWLAVITNDRRTVTDPLGAAAEAAMRQWRNPEPPTFWRVSDALLTHYFGPGGYLIRTCENRQRLDRESFLGLWRSRSRVPQPGEPGHDELVAAMTAVFDAHHQDGQVTVTYDTTIRLGQPR